MEQVHQVALVRMRGEGLNQALDEPRAVMEVAMGLLQHVGRGDIFLIVFRASSREL